MLVYMQRSTQTSHFSISLRLFFAGIATKLSRGVDRETRRLRYGHHLAIYSGRHVYFQGTVAVETLPYTHSVQNTAQRGQENLDVVAIAQQMGTTTNRVFTLCVQGPQLDSLTLDFKGTSVLPNCRLLAERSA